MDTNSDKYKPEDYEGDMARLCEKIKYVQNDNYEFTIKQMVEPRNTNLEGLGRRGYSKEGYGDIKIPILKDMEFIEMTSENTFRLTERGKKYCEKTKVV